MFSALTKSIQARPGFSNIQSDIFAGLTVGLIALPLSMALAIASGVPPQHGLYTAMIAGIVIALTGGSKVNISGPTAAFVVVLLPIVQNFGALPCHHWFYCRHRCRHRHISNQGFSRA